MISRRNIITTKFLSLAFLVAWEMPAFAHEGFDHVTGTVAAVSGGILTVKTAKGNVDVKLDSKTEFSRGTQKAQVSDLKTGLRVVVDIPEDSKDKIAHSVKLGTAPATDHSK
jgi:hypothetical protein